jgi:catechol 2,3-dioxygenase-like lactoylglutathione lyase family enzyme
VARVQHVTITVPDEGLLPAVEDFYHLLGGVSQTRPERLVADTPGRWLGFESTQVHLVIGAPVADPAHFALDLGSEFDRVVERLASRKVFVREARDLWGARRCFVRDPAGNRVELFERAPEST